MQYRKLNVHRTLTCDEKGRVTMGNKTKTYAGKRVLPIPEFLLPYFVEWIVWNKINYKKLKIVKTSIALVKINFCKLGKNIIG